MFETLEWSRPEALWLLLLPLLVLFFARFLVRPQTRATGTLDIWKTIVSEAASVGHRSQRRVPLALWLLLMSLCVGALAVSDPRPKSKPRLREFVCVVDSSPSMYLRHGDATRIELAVAAAEEWLRVTAHEEDRVSWVRVLGDVRELVDARTVPNAWLEPPPVAQPATRWSDFDMPGALWITDAPIAGNAVFVFASGGEAVPGPVATQGTTRFDWNGSQVLKVENGAQRATLSWPAEDETRIASEVLAFARVWAAERGLEVETGTEHAWLELRAAEGEPRKVRLARDGWSFEGDAISLREVASSNPWIGDSEHDYVRATPGVIECGLVRAERIGGDSAAFAVSWAELFDRAVLPAAGVVALSERLAAGEAAVHIPESAALLKKRTVPQGGVRPAAWLATIAFVLALLASLPSLRRAARP